MDRRTFAQLCGGSALASALASTPWAHAATADYEPARLVLADGSPLRATDVGPEQALVFAYPYRGVPCFLINLGDRQVNSAEHESPDDGPYQNPPGAGPGGHIVAFVAVCTHQLSYPQKHISTIRYEPGPSTLSGQAGCIVCCAHGSVFDPAAAGQPVHGPSQYPLLPVRLAWNEEDDSLRATGSVGDAFFQRFFAAHKPELIDDYGPGQYRQPVGDTTVVTPLSDYAATVSAC